MNASDTKHTPTPWQFVDGFIMAGGEALKVIGVQTPMTSGPSRIEAVHNSGLIVRAVNSHADMLAALKAAEALAVCGMAVDCYSRREIEELCRGTIETFRVALRKAEGRAS